MACTCSPALVALRDQLDAAYPGRQKAADGCCASAAHHQRSPNSDHEPDANGFAHAYDVTTDPHIDMQGLADRLLYDPRTKYVIWNRRIADARGPWRPYSGPDPHTGHLHLSIAADATHDTWAWPIAPEENDLTPEQAATLQQTHDAVAAIQGLLQDMANKLNEVWDDHHHDRP